MTDAEIELLADDLMALAIQTAEDMRAARNAPPMPAGSPDITDLLRAEMVAALRAELRPSRVEEETST